jgi:hypothetical protein
MMPLTVLTKEGQILMGKKGARLFQRETDTLEHSWNMVQLEVLESRRQLRQQVNELIRLGNNPSITTSEMKQLLHLAVAKFGTQLATQPVRSLHRDDPQERQAMIWLLTLFNDNETITPLLHMSRDKHIPRSIRLSASLALAGMGVTAETIDNHRRIRLYAIS